ncbi:hypothetical protein [Ktedonospora formicarum]|uniref:Uncharacterized protein n=1 Tax=Ktedonospora formicarum TaxID=2778364 RepID=A0A8J3MTR1_9CHLR|nr:hypothetical protein [Ktedonospora formicarum]GHO48477.1 hypothetical protein KSX_66400 [Ktedonospora formicarum]
MLNQALGSDGLIIPRISASPITQVRWTRQGPVLTLLLEDAYGEAHLAFRPITTREWVSLIQLTGVMSQYIALG